MTDEMLAWQTAQRLAREIGRDGHTVHVRPERRAWPDRYAL